MKKLITVFLVVLFLFSSALLALAHPGNTDIRGGHRDSDTGIYHYHHGYPAHQHPNGECPYNFEDKSSSYGSNSSNDFYSTTESSAARTTAKTTKPTDKESDNMSFWIVLLTLLLIGSFIYILCLKDDIKKLRNKLENEYKETQKLKEKLNKKKKEIDKYTDELIYHTILKNALENAKAPKFMLCGTPFLKKAKLLEERYIEELRNNYYLEYHNSPLYIETNKIITDVLGSEVIYTYDYLVERCFKHIYSFEGKFFPKEDIIKELQIFLYSWLSFYPQLINNMDENSLALHTLIALSKNLLLNGTTKTDIFGLYKYKNNNTLTLEGKDLKEFMAYCYTELYRYDKITEKTMKACIAKIGTTFPDEKK